VVVVVDDGREAVGAELPASFVEMVSLATWFGTDSATVPGCSRSSSRRGSTTSAPSSRRA